MRQAPLSCLIIWSMSWDHGPWKGIFHPFGGGSIAFSGPSRQQSCSCKHQHQLDTLYATTCYSRVLWPNHSCSAIACIWIWFLCTQCKHISWIFTSIFNEIYHSFGCGEFWLKLPGSATTPRCHLLPDTKFSSTPNSVSFFSMTNESIYM